MSRTNSFLWLVPVAVAIAVAGGACAATSAQVADTEVVESASSTALATAPREGGYDPALAAEVGADEYGMKQYVFAFLGPGPNRDQSEQEAEKLQRAHLDNIRRLAEQGKLVLAGPFMGEGDYLGIYVFDVRTVEEARALASSDPAIRAGRLTLTLVPWYGSAALIKLNELHKRVAKANP